MNLRQLKSKIKSIHNVGQITRAMELVSAVKMKKSQAKAIEGKPYRGALEETIASLLGGSSVPEHPLTVVKPSALKKIAVIVSSNKALCGVFNFNLFRFIAHEITNIKDYQFVVVGSKAQQFIFHLGGEIIADFSATLPFESSTSAIFSLLRERFVSSQNSQVELFYNRFITSLVSKPTKKTLMPLTREAFVFLSENKENKQGDYVVEPTVNTVIDGLFNFFIESEIRGAIQESAAAEHSARMIAMKNATDNSKDLVYRLTLLRNSIRQEKITNELLDMNTARLAVS